MRTWFAPAKRADNQILNRDFDIISKNALVTQVLDAIPAISAILNEERQIVYANDTVLSHLSIENIHDIIGMRPGEAIHCIHATTCEAGCGTSKNCKYCGAVNSILQCQKTGKKVSQECRINVIEHGLTKSLDLMATASPLAVSGKNFTILSFTDISDQKRRNMLERIFFHDLINKAGGLHGFLEYILTINNPEKVKGLSRVALDLSSEIIDDIIYQKQLLDAEKDMLVLDFNEEDANEIIKTVVTQMSKHEVSKSKKIAIGKNTKTIKFKTDALLLKRVLINMLKNALEASQENEVVTIGCEKREKTILFWVNNTAEMPEEVKLQVFQRSFSTKGRNRGLGTYSIKLIGVNYLKSKVYFTSDKSNGTTFYIEHNL